MPTTSPRPASWANAGEKGEGSYIGSRGLYPADGTPNVNVGVADTYDTVRFVDYVEGIYVGYRWYETADAEGFWDSVGKRARPGLRGRGPVPVWLRPQLHGLRVGGREPHAASGDARLPRDRPFSITVRVTNTGEVAGRDVVQLYCTPPYSAGGIEKASTVLV